MKEFDYSRAYEELAEPAWKALPVDVQSLIERVIVTAANVKQDRATLDTQWPVNEHGVHTLKIAFAMIPSDQLARAARAVYFSGHWAAASTGDEGVRLQEHGAYWKFSSYCDQILRECLDLPSADDRTRGSGTWQEVHQGYLRLCVSTPDSWAHYDIGPATQEVYDAIELGRPSAPCGPRSQRTREKWDDYMGACKALADAVRLRFRPTDGSPDLLDTERFMKEKS